MGKSRYPYNIFFDGDKCNEIERILRILGVTLDRDRSLYLPYLALESTLSRVDLLIERLPQFDEPIKTELLQSLFYPHAHNQAQRSARRD